MSIASSMQIKWNSSVGTALRIGFGAFAALVAGSAVALAPPSAGSLEQYRVDGTLVKRQAFAQDLGNNTFEPALVGAMRQRLEGSGLSGAPPSAWGGGMPASGTPKAVVLLVDFPDYPSDPANTQADVYSKFFGSGSVSDAPYESLRNFYQRASYNTLTIGGNVLGWYRAGHNRSYYEALGSGPGQEALMSEAMNYFASPAGGSHNFAQYDNDNNGTIDAVYIKWTGPDNGWSNFWWAYQWSWHSTPSYTVSGKRIGKYIWSWIANSSYDGQTVYKPRVDIHETGHILGLPDLYDYDTGVGPNGGVGGLDMMHGNWGDHNSFSKAMLGWITPTVVASGTQVRSLSPSGTSTDAVLIMPSASGNLFSEFYMAQYRKRSTGNDPANYPTDGLTIWHVDATLNAGGTNFLYDNSYTSHKLLTLMQADGLGQIESSSASADAGDFYVSPKTLTPLTTPNSNRFNGTSSNVYVTSIGAGGGATMNATFSIGTPVVSTAIKVDDFNGDSKSDLLWQQNSTGYAYMSLMDGATTSSSTFVGGGSGWIAVGNGDFNGDGKSDILWQQSSTGFVYMSLMNGATTSSTTYVGGGAGWSVVGVGDFNGDGKSDILWQQTSTGYVYLTVMNGSTTSSSTYVGGGAGWIVAGVRDFNGDNKSDILWQQTSTGYAYMSLMNGATTSSTTYVGGGAGWSVAGTGDFNGDGKNDILWQQNSTSYVYMSLMNGATTSSTTYVGGGAGWSVIATGDYNADGKSDIVWQQSSTGYAYMSLMNGATTSSTTYVGGGSGWSLRSRPQ